MSNTITATDSLYLAGRWFVATEGYAWLDRLSTEDGAPEALLVARGQHFKPYAVLRRAGLLLDFQQLARRPSPEGVVRFATRYGGLTRIARQLYSDGAASQLTLPPGASVAEPWSLWQAELNQMTELARIWDDIDGTSYRPVAERLRAQLDGAGVAIRGRDLAATARRYLADRINQKLIGRVNLSILPAAGYRLQSTPRDLIGAIYIRFAVELSSGRQTERMCGSCGVPFHLKRPDQLWCSPDCGNRARVRRSRARRRQ